MDIAINIGACLENEHFSVIFANFNLVQAVAFRRYLQSLEPINALLGCRIVLPSLFKNPTTFMVVNAKACVNTYLYTINWFREIINGFVAFEEPLLRKKVMCRLKHLIELERTFYNVIMPLVNSKKKSKTHQNRQVAQAAPTQVNATTGNVNIITQQQGGLRVARNATIECTFIGNQEIRQLKPDIMLLFQQDFELAVQGEAGSKLHLTDLKFLADDLVLKLESIPSANKVNQKTQTILEPVAFVTNVVRNLENIMKCFKPVSLHSERFFKFNNFMELFHILRVQNNTVLSQFAIITRLFV